MPRGSPRVPASPVSLTHRIHEVIYNLSTGPYEEFYNHVPSYRAQLMQILPALLVTCKALTGRFQKSIPGFLRDLNDTEANKLRQERSSHMAASPATATACAVGLTARQHTPPASVAKTTGTQVPAPETHLPDVEERACVAAHAVAAQAAGARGAAVWLSRARVRACCVQIILHFEAMLGGLVARDVASAEIEKYLTKLDLYCASGTTAADLLPRGRGGVQKAIKQHMQSRQQLASPGAAAAATESGDVALRVWIERTVLVLYYAEFGELAASMYRQQGGDVKVYLAARAADAAKSARLAAASGTSVVGAGVVGVGVGVGVGAETTMVPFGVEDVSASSPAPTPRIMRFNVPVNEEAESAREETGKGGGVGALKRDTLRNRLRGMREVVIRGDTLISERDSDGVLCAGRRHAALALGQTKRLNFQRRTGAAVVADADADASATNTATVTTFGGFRTPTKRGASSGALADSDHGDDGDEIKVHENGSNQAGNEGSGDIMMSNRVSPNRPWFQGRQGMEAHGLGGGSESEDDDDEIAIRASQESPTTRRIGSSGLRRGDFPPLGGGGILRPARKRQLFSAIAFGTRLRGEEVASVSALRQTDTQVGAAAVEAQTQLTTTAQLLDGERLAVRPAKRSLFGKALARYQAP